MSRIDNDIQHRAADAGQWPPPGTARLLPKVTFGLGTAVLAGVVVVSVPAAPALFTTADAPTVTAAGAAAPPAVGLQVITTAGLGAAINAVAVSVARETTCCG